MKIAIATDNLGKIAGHAGKARFWRVYDYVPGAPLLPPARIELPPELVFHHWSDENGLAGHPLDGIELILAKSAGDSFLKRMQHRGIEVMLTAETDAAAALEKLLAGEALADPRWDVSQLLCKLRDVFARH